MIALFSLTKMITRKIRSAIRYLWWIVVSKASFGSILFFFFFLIRGNIFFKIFDISLMFYSLYFVLQITNFFSICFFPFDFISCKNSTLFLSLISLSISSVVSPLIWIPSSEVFFVLKDFVPSEIVTCMIHLIIEEHLLQYLFELWSCF